MKLYKKSKKETFNKPYERMTKQERAKLYDYLSKLKIGDCI